MNKDDEKILNEEELADYKKRFKKIELERELYFAEQTLRSEKGNSYRARSIGVGTAFGGAVEVTVRGEETYLWLHLQPVEVMELIHQMSASIGCHLSLKPRDDFGSWRNWNIPEEFQSLVNTSAAAKPLLSGSEQPQQLLAEELAKQLLANQQSNSQLPVEREKRLSGTAPQHISMGGDQHVANEKAAKMKVPKQDINLSGIEKGGATPIIDPEVKKKLLKNIPKPFRILNPPITRGTTKTIWNRGEEFKAAERAYIAAKDTYYLALEEKNNISAEDLDNARIHLEEKERFYYELLDQINEMEKYKKDRQNALSAKTVINE